MRTSTPRKTSLNSRYKLVKKSSIWSPRGEKSQATRGVGTPTTIPREITRQNSFKKLGSYRLQRVVTPPSTYQQSRPRYNTKQYNSNQPTTPSHSVDLTSGRGSLNSERKSRFKLVRLRRTLSNSRALGDTRRLRVTPSPRCIQRQGSCEKRVTRYKLVRVRKSQVDSEMNRPELKLKTHYKLVRVRPPSKTPVRRLSQRKGKCLVNHAMARQLIRKEDGSFVLRSRYCLIKNSGTGVLPWQQSGSVYKTGHLNNELSVRKLQVTVQATAQ